MKRCIAVLLMLVVSMVAYGQGAPVVGKEFKLLDPPQPVSGNQVEVLEFFNYACSHCDAFEPTLNGWLSSKPKGVTFRHVPAIFNKRMIPLAQLYYALEETDNLGKLHARVYDAIHRQGKNLVNRQTIMEWVAAQGVDMKKFEAAYDSFSVGNKTQRAMQMTRSYRVPGTPYLVVNGKYLTGPSMVIRSDGRGVDATRFIYVLNTLIDMEN